MRALCSREQYDFEPPPDRPDHTLPSTKGSLRDYLELIIATYIDRKNTKVRWDRNSSWGFPHVTSESVFGKDVTPQIHSPDKHGCVIINVILPDETNVNH